jgi:GMP synthase-like glutamine amidotransferase
MKIHVFEHDQTETLGSISDWIVSKGHDLSVTSWHLGDRPARVEADLLVVMGGPMNIYEEEVYPWLLQEKALLDASIGAGMWCLGVCLGAQLLADRLGGRVTKGTHTEIGWYPIRRLPEADADTLFAVLPLEFNAMHWHGDTFAIPPGAIHGYASSACRNQAFRKSRVIGLQCHLEFTPGALSGLIDAQDRFEGPFTQSPAEFLDREQDFVTLERQLFAFLDQLEMEIRAAK